MCISHHTKQTTRAKTNTARKNLWIKSVKVHQAEYINAALEEKMQQMCTHSFS